MGSQFTEHKRYPQQQARDGKWTKTPLAYQGPKHVHLYWFANCQMFQHLGQTIQPMHIAGMKLICKKHDTLLINDHQG